MRREPWTTRQEEILRERGHLGAEEVCRAILAECGVRRSVHAVQHHASRCHVSLRLQQVCPECGVVGLPLNRRTGLCPACTARQHLEEEIAFNEILEAERLELADAAHLEEARREYDAMRQRNSRLRRKYGLASRRERRAAGRRAATA